MAINFPDSPSAGDPHTEAGVTWTYDGEKWVSNNTAAPAALWTRSGTTLSPATAGDDVDLGTGDLSAAAGTFGLTEITDDTQINFHQGNFGLNADSNRVTFTRDQANMSGTVPYGTFLGRVNDGGTLTDACALKLQRDDGAGFSTGGCFIFETNDSNSGNSQKMRLRENGDLQIGGNIPSVPNIVLKGENGRAQFGSTAGLSRKVNIEAASASGGNALFVRNATNGATTDMVTIQCGTNAGDTGTRYINFRRQDGTIVGYVGMNGASAITFSTNSSDYRLKENVVPLPDSIERLKALRPVRFNFITSPDEIFDGFIAHECIDIPKAVIGEKDAVDEKGEVLPQGLDTTRMIPLLTDALQKALTRIEALEAEVQSLKGGS